MPSRPLNEHEIKRVLNVLPNLRDKTLFLLGVKTGFRISELLSLTLSDVYKDGKILDSVTVKRANMKGRAQSRTVVLHKQAKKALLTFTYVMQNLDLKSSDKLFPMTRQHAWRIIKCAARQAELQGRISTHSMRKSFGMSIYTRSGNDLKAAQLALGHKSIASTGHYLSVDSDTIDNLILTS